MRYNAIGGCILRQKAFTLSEMLLVIAIIGIVSSMTLPNLSNFTGNKETITMVKKVYNEMTDAYNRAQVAYGPVKTWCLELDADACSKRIGERFTEFLKVKKVCGVDTSRACFTDSRLKMLNGGTTYNTNDYGGYKVILQTGPSVSLSLGCDVRIDIDGPNKGPNTEGRDVFTFCTLNPLNNEYTFTPRNDTNADVVNASGMNAASWIIKHENMDYLKAEVVDSYRVKCMDSSVILDGISIVTCK